MKTKKMAKKATKRAIYKNAGKIYIKKSLVILTAVLTAVSVIGYQGQRLSAEIKHPVAEINAKRAKTVVYAEPAKILLKNDLKAKNETVKLNYEIVGVKLNERQKKVANEIITIAKKEDFKWIPYLLELSWCESKLGERMVGTIGNNPPSRDRGYFQINDYWHKDITDKQAFDLEWSTKWTMNMINKGYQNRWSCDKIVRTNKIKIELK